MYGVWHNNVITTLPHIVFHIACKVFVLNSLLKLLGELQDIDYFKVSLGTPYHPSCTLGVQYLEHFYFI